MGGQSADFDLAIVGAGINGVGIARDAAGRGLNVLVVEQDDLAWGTSGASTKLIHGGLRYLEHGWLRLVREALAEREVLLRMTPHLVRPLRFVLPQDAGLRPAWFVRAGLFLYDHLGGRQILPPTATVDLAHGPLGAPLRERYRHTGFEYSDCQTDDARLVVLNALDAAERGAAIRTRTRCIGAERGDTWRLTLQSNGASHHVTARVLVNATGPWADLVAEGVLGARDERKLRLDKGSHIVVPRLFEHDRGYVFQIADGRVVFALPFELDFTLVGTTDRTFAGDPATVAPAPDEIAYLCAVVNDHFRATISPAQVVWSFAGVRALYDDGSRRPQDTPRDYVLSFDRERGRAPLLTVYGGKITTYRRLAEAALDRLVPVLGGGAAWTRQSHLPGGDFAVDGLAGLLAQTRSTWPFLEVRHAERLIAAYGTRVGRILGASTSYDDLGPRFGAGADLTPAEVRYMMAHEWARTADDVLWRRSKLGLRLSADERAALARFMASASPAQPSG